MLKPWIMNESQKPNRSTDNVLLKYVTFSAHSNFLLPVFLDCPFANSPVDKPAQVWNLKLPGRAAFAVFSRAFSHGPTGFLSFRVFVQIHKKIHLSFSMNRYFPPALLKTLYSLCGNSQKLRHLFLGFTQTMSYFRKFFFVHSVAELPSTI